MTLWLCGTLTTATANTVLELNSKPVFITDNSNPFFKMESIPGKYEIIKAELDDCIAIFRNDRIEFLETLLKDYVVLSR